MNWKKSVLAFFCAAVLILGLGLPGAQAADGEIIFLALNDQMYTPFTPETMPISVGNIYYVPYTTFDSNIAPVNLGTIVSYRDNVVSLFNKQRLLKFDLNAGTCEDRDGNRGYTKAIVRGGIIYLPLRSVCAYFELDYSQIATAYGPLLRIKTAAVELDDDRFRDAAETTTIPYQYKIILSLLNPAPSTTASAVPSSPAPSISPSSQPGEPDKSGVRVCIAFRHTNGTGLRQIINTLKSSSVTALVLFPPDAVYENAALIRQIVGIGSAVGFTIPGGPAEDAAAVLAEGNRQLELVAHSNTRTVLIENSDADTAAVLKADGWSLWQENVSVSPAGTASAYASALLEKAQSRRTVARITLADDTHAAAALPRLLQGLQEQKYSIRQAVGAELD